MTFSAGIWPDPESGDLDPQTTCTPALLNLVTMALPKFPVPRTPILRGDVKTTDTFDEGLVSKETLHSKHVLDQGIILFYPLDSCKSSSTLLWIFYQWS